MSERKSGFSTPHSRRLLLAAGAVAGVLWGPQAFAAEGGASMYLLGGGVPESAITPPVQGVFLDDQAYYYDGASSGSKQFVVGGNLVAGLQGRIAADFATLAWVPTTHFLGGTLELGAALPFGAVNADVNAALQGPLGRRINVITTDSTFTVGDPLLLGVVGWSHGDWHYAASEVVNVPIGDYHDGALANLAFHRWVADTSGAITWHDEKTGWDVSAKTGLSFNGTNHATDYTTGTEFHLEGSVEKTVAKAFSLGVIGYYYRQITGDSGSGATLGPFEGRVIGLGGTAAHTFMLGHMPATLRLRAGGEFDVRNRMTGNFVSLDLGVPLKLILPAAARP